MHTTIMLTVGAAFLTLCSLADLVQALPVIQDQCNQTSGDGQGHRCPGANDLLIRPKYSDGTCGDWMCCPPNGDGTYDCTRATNPARATVPGRLKGLLGARATVLSPTPGAGSQIQPMFKGQHAPILRRGIDEATADQPQDDVTQDTAQGSESPAETPPDEIQDRAVPRLGPGITGDPRRPMGPRVAAATTDVSCSDGKNYTISTGTKAGSCQLVREGGRVLGGYCGDSKGNASSVFCANGCTGATGAGSCSKKAQ